MAVGHIPIPRISAASVHNANSQSVCRACSTASPGSAEWCDCCTNRCGSASSCESHAAVCAELHANRLQLAEIERRENAAQRNAIFGVGKRDVKQSANSNANPKPLVVPHAPDLVTNTYRGRPAKNAINDGAQNVANDMPVREMRQDTSRLRARWSSATRKAADKPNVGVGAVAPGAVAVPVARVAAIRERMRDDAMRDNVAVAAEEQRRVDEALAARNELLDAQQRQQDEARRASDAFIDAALQERKQKQMEEIAKARLAIEAQREAGEHEAKAAAAKLLASMELSARDVIKVGWHSTDTYLLQLFTPDCVVCPDHDRVLLLVSRALMRQPGLEIGRVDCAAMHALCSRIGVRVFPTLVAVVDKRVYFLPRAKGEDPDAVIEFATGRYTQQQSMVWPWANAKPQDNDNDDFDLVEKLIAEAAEELAAKRAPQTTTTTTTTTPPMTTTTTKTLYERTKPIVDPMLPQHEKLLTHNENWL